MNFRRRLRQRRPMKRCSVEKCKSTASRFIDVGPERKWLCALHFEIENGEFVSGCANGDRVTNILIETGPRAVGLFERKQFG